MGMPSVDLDLAFAGVAGQAGLVRRGEVSARELVEAALARIERFDGELNSFATVYAERAPAEADRADRLRSRGEGGPLLGVPVGVKDEIDLAGEVTSRGTGGFLSRANADAEVVRRLRDAGAIVIGKTTMPELGFWPFTESITWGVTLFETEDAMRRGDEALNAMNPGASERRTSVEFYEVLVQTVT